jgi:hypothetical protein
MKRKSTDQEILQGKDDLAMMQRPDLWGRWPELPLVRVSGLPGQDECGVLLDRKARRWDVVLGNIFGPRDRSKVLAYESPEEVLAAGWRVD